MATTYDFPDDLLTAQHALNQVRADLEARDARLPYAVEPMEAWQRPDGYWLDRARSYPDSPGWSEQEFQEVAALREKERDLAAAIVTHAFWGGVAGSERPDARSTLKHALGETKDGQEQR